jgi:hypothetical protein
MTHVAWTFMRSAGWGRAALLAGATAVATALLLVALTMRLLPGQPAEALFNLVAEPGLRWGTELTTAMLVLPLLLMLNQAVRLGTATRQRRLAALRLAGATPAEVRRIGALEVGLPVTAGAMSGPLVFALLRSLFGGQAVEPAASMERLSDPLSSSALALIPTSVAPAWWQTAAVVVSVALAGVLTGALASRRVIASPLGVSRRVRGPAPRLWGLLLVGTGLGSLAAAVSGWFGRSKPEALAGVLLVVLGAIALAPWVALRAGQRAERHTSDPATLIAAAHLVGDPGPAGRAAAAIGAIGIVSGAAAVIEADLLSFSHNGGAGIEPFYVTSFALLGAALLLVLLVTTSTLAVHAAESLVDRRRVLAGLLAAGTPVSVLRDALRQEAMLTSMPLSIGGVVTGAVLTSAADPPLTVAGLLLLGVQLLATVALTWVAIRIAIRAVAPRLLLAAAPANLRIE